MGRTEQNLVWVLARRHTWGDPLPEDVLVRYAAKGEDEDVVRETLHKEVSEFPFVSKATTGYYIPNSQEKHVQAADWLQEHTAISDIQIKATLSRLPDSWPTED